jgi:hypothetical protein
MDERAAHWTNTANRMQTRLIEQAWNEKRGAFTAGFGIDDLDASVLLLPEIGLLETHDPRFVRTVEAIERELLRGNHIMRYASEDDFGPAVEERDHRQCRLLRPRRQRPRRHRSTEPRDELAPPRRRKRQASHARWSRSSMSIPTRRSSILRSQRAVT